MNAVQQYDNDWQRYLDQEMDASEEAVFLERLCEKEREDALGVKSALSALEGLPRFNAPAILVENIMGKIVPKKRSAWGRLRSWMEARPMLGWEFAGTGLAAFALIVILAPLSFTKTEGDVLHIASHSSASFASLKRVANHSSGDGNVAHFSLYAPQADSVTLVGDFNGWGSVSEIRLKSAGSGRWEVTTPLPSGRYQYAFLVDGQRWVTDPQAEQHISDDFGRQNAVVTIL